MSIEQATPQIQYVKAEEEELLEAATVVTTAAKEGLGLGVGGGVG